MIKLMDLQNPHRLFLANISFFHIICRFFIKITDLSRETQNEFLLTQIICNSHFLISTVANIYHFQSLIPYFDFYYFSISIHMIARTFQWFQTFYDSIHVIGRFCPGIDTPNIFFVLHQRDCESFNFSRMRLRVTKKLMKYKKYIRGVNSFTKLQVNIDQQKSTGAKTTNYMYRIVECLKPLEGAGNHMDGDTEIVEIEIRNKALEMINVGYSGNQKV
ncbi:hypothetical protein BDA99DRAFT_533846 [Phascolomyces articulosus]|uniref:Uncharacterized protein n=1 Tax=Phascolomyces articulosus TaxID=60185 RepID=A0AAD5KPU1_9FUNG|nr:hypothetical protein BDA99DRAFT_533846 [Phascolomyces articulosus]